MSTEFNLKKLPLVMLTFSAGDRGDPSSVLEGEEGCEIARLQRSRRFSIRRTSSRRSSSLRSGMSGSRLDAFDASRWVTGLEAVPTRRPKVTSVAQMLWAHPNLDRTGHPGSFLSVSGRSQSALSHPLQKEQPVPVWKWTRGNV